jgi:hypothetical protein
MPTPTLHDPNDGGIAPSLPIHAHRIERYPAVILDEFKGDPVGNRVKSMLVVLVVVYIACGHGVCLEGFQGERGKNEGCLGEREYSRVTVLVSNSS